MSRGWIIRRINKNEKFSVIIVPHDLQKTRTYKISYLYFYVFVGVLAAGILGITIFLATYGNLLVKAREIVMLERQVEELTRRNEKIGTLMRDLAELNVMEIKVRRLLGAARADSTWTAGAVGGGRNRNTGGGKRKNADASRISEFLAGEGAYHEGIQRDEREIGPRPSSRNRHRAGTGRADQGRGGGICHRGRMGRYLRISCYGRSWIWNKNPLRA